MTSTERLEPRKFVVSRTDPEAEARHQGCRFFVLDLTHDPLARSALHAYAIAAAEVHPQLAADLNALLAQVRPTLGVSGER